MQSDYYAPGTYNDPNAPWNQEDESDEVELGEFNHQEELEARYREKRHERYKD